MSAVAQAVHSWRANGVVAGGLRVIRRVDTEGNNSGVTSIAKFPEKFWYIVHSYQRSHPKSTNVTFNLKFHAARVEEKKKIFEVSEQLF